MRATKFKGITPFLLVLGPVGKLAPSLHCNLLVARCSVPRSTCSSLVGIPATGPRVLVFDTMRGKKMHLFSLVHRIVFVGCIELQSQHIGPSISKSCLLQSLSDTLRVPFVFMDSLATVFWSSGTL